MSQPIERVRVVILTSRGPRHSYFCRELAKNFKLAGIVVDDRYHFFDRARTFLGSNGLNPLRMVRSVRLKSQLAPYEARDRAIEEKFFPSDSSEGEFPRGVPVRWSRDPNHEETIQWVRRLAPDVLAVFGTRLIRGRMISLARYGALNLHTGLSPFYRGGQCTFWCLYEGNVAHLGVTVHHLSDRIDGGDIVYTAKPGVEVEDTVRSLECKLVRLGTERMIQAIQELREGRAPRCPQREKGKLFLSKMFTLEKRLELEKKLESGWLRDLLQRAKREEVSV